MPFVEEDIEDINEQNSQKGSDSESSLDENEIEQVKQEMGAKQKKRLERMLNTKINPMQLIDDFPRDPAMDVARDFWQSWINLLQKMFSLNPKLFPSSELKLTVLLAKGGPYIRKILESHSECSFDGAVKIVDEYMASNSNVIADEAVFRSVKQMQGESFEKFSDRVRKKAKVFKINEESRIVSQVASGALMSEKLAEYIVQPDVTLAKVICFGNNLEALNAQRKPTNQSNEVFNLNKSFKSAGNRFKPYDRSNRGTAMENSKGNGNTTRGEKECFYCGLNHIKGRCPAYGVICNRCGGKDHYARKCMKKVNEMHYESKVERN